MILTIKPTQKTLHALGYKDDKKGSYKKEIRKGRPFPRFHINFNDDFVDIHIDSKRIHGFMMRFIGKAFRSNIIKFDKRLSLESRRIEIEQLYSEAVTIKDAIDKKVLEFGELKKRL